ncbi:MAG: hypothetical protein JKX82_00485, partial [Oleispira sp.]|nr:hypothetical protein [Oleispira sp.]
SSSEIDNKLFKSFISWGESNEALFPDVVITLKGLPSNKIKRPFIPRIIEFFKICNKPDELIELTDSWKKEKPSLKKTIEQELK